MKKPLLILLLLFPLFSLGFSQDVEPGFEQKDKKAKKITQVPFFVKLNLGFSYQWAENFNGQTQQLMRASRWSIGQLQPGFGWRSKRGNIHLFEFTPLEIGSDTRRFLDGTSQDPELSRQRRYAVGVKYEHDFVFLKASDFPVRPYIGPNISYAYYRDRSIPEVSTAFPRRLQVHRFGGGVTVGAMYEATDRIFVDLRFPTDIVSGRFITARDEDPSVPVPNRSRAAFNTFSPITMQFKVAAGVGFWF